MDPESLEGSLEILTGADGGTAAVAIELRNRSSVDLLLKVNTEMSAVIVITAADTEGRVLSKGGKKFDSSEAQRFTAVRIPPSSSHRWRVPLSTQLPLDAIPDAGVRGRLVVNVALLFRKASSGHQPTDDDYTTSIMTLSATDVLFTRAALRET